VKSYNFNIAFGKELYNLNIAIKMLMHFSFIFTRIKDKRKTNPVSTLL